MVSPLGGRVVRPAAQPLAGWRPRGVGVSGHSEDGVGQAGPLAVSQRGEAQLHDLPGALADRRVDGGRQSGQVKGQDSLGGGGQQLLAVQAVVGRPLGTVRLHDALKVATEGVFCTAARARDQDRGFQGRMMVVKEGLCWSAWREGRDLTTTKVC